MSPVSATPAAAPDPRPAWVDDLAGQLECDRALDPRLGTELTLGLKPIDPARSPAEAQRVALMSYTSLPVQGYAPIEVAGNWARHTYVVDGRLKVVMVSTDRFEDYPKVEGWEVVGIRACDLSEFRQADLAADGPTIWRDAHEVPVVSDVALSFPGPGHCGWESMVFLYLSGEQFIRDPNGLLRDHTVVSFDPTVRLPEDAIDTGLHTDRWHLFEIPSGRAVFVVTSAGAVERWPRAKQDVGCM